MLWHDKPRKHPTVCRQKTAVIKFCFHFYFLMPLCLTERPERSVFERGARSTTSLFRDRTTGGVNRLGLSGIGAVWHLLPPLGDVDKAPVFNRILCSSFLAHRWRDDPPLLPPTSQTFVILLKHKWVLLLSSHPPPPPHADQDGIKW